MLFNSFSSALRIGLYCLSPENLLVEWLKSCWRVKSSWQCVGVWQWQNIKARRLHMCWSAFSEVLLVKFLIGKNMKTRDTTWWGKGRSCLPCSWVVIGSWESLRIGAWHFLNIFLDYFVFINVLPAYMCLHHMYTWCPQTSKENAGSSGTRVRCLSTDVLCRCWGLCHILSKSKHVLFNLSHHSPG